MKTPEAKFKDIERALHKLRKENLLLRLHMEQLMDDINSSRAKKILAFWRRKRTQREESYLAQQN